MIPLDEVVHFDVTTRGTSGVVDADSAPTFDVFEEATDTPILDDQTMTKRTSLTGNYRGTFTASAANGFEVGKWYNVVAMATVAGITDKTVALTFRLSAAESIAGTPKTDLAALGGSTTPVTNLGTVYNTDFATNYDSTNDMWMANVKRVNGTAQTAGDLSAQIDAIDNFLDTEIADIVTKIGTPSDLGSGATLAANLVDIESQTDDIGVAGAGLTAVLTTTLTESYRGTGAAGSAAQVLYELLANIVEHSNSGTTRTAKKLDGSTTAKTYTYNDASNPTSITETT